MERHFLQAEGGLFSAKDQNIFLASTKHITLLPRKPEAQYYRT